MKKHLISLVYAAAVAVLGTTASSAQSTNVGVDVNADNVDVQVFVNRKPDNRQFVPAGFAVDVTSNCLYFVGTATADEYASWSGACDARGYIAGVGRLSFTYPSGAPGNYAAYMEGVFADGRLNGYGRILLLNGQKRQGEFRNGALSGQAEITYTDGARYSGEWRQGAFNGQGRMLYPNGDYYIGQFRDGKRHGHGELRKVNGQHYVGDFQHNEASGHGLLLMANGECFEGQFTTVEAYLGTAAPGGVAARGSPSGWRPDAP